MGAGNAKGPAIGVSANPRVNYANQLSKQKGKAVLIDAPILCKLDNGTVRYRYTERENEPSNKNKRIERPHEGEERNLKRDYFFHHNHKDLQNPQKENPEESWKYCYIYKGPNETKQKKIHYVYGKGMKVNEEGFIEPKYKSVSQGQGFVWPSMFKEEQHLYYDLTILRQETELEDFDDYEYTENLGPLMPGAACIEMVVSDEDILGRIKERLALRMGNRPMENIHLYRHGQELLYCEDTVGTLRLQSDGDWQKFKILLRPK